MFRSPSGASAESLPCHLGPLLLPKLLADGLFSEETPSYYAVEQKGVSRFPVETALEKEAQHITLQEHSPACDEV